MGHDQREVDEALDEGLTGEPPREQVGQRDAEEQAEQRRHERSVDAEVQDAVDVRVQGLLDDEPGGLPGDEHDQRQAEGDGQETAERRGGDGEAAVVEREDGAARAEDDVAEEPDRVAQPGDRRAREETDEAPEPVRPRERDRLHREVPGGRPPDGSVALVDEGGPHRAGHDRVGVPGRPADRVERPERHHLDGDESRDGRRPAGGHGRDPEISLRRHGRWWGSLDSHGA